MPRYRARQSGTTIKFLREEGSPYEDGQKKPRHKDYVGTGHRPGGRDKWDRREFIAWDGEGIEVDEPTDYGRGLHIDDLGRPVVGYTPKPQPYVLLANSKGEYITAEDGLSTVDCLDLLLDAKQRYPNSIFVGFSFNYDVNQILKDLDLHDLPPKHKREWRTPLETLHETNQVNLGDYMIKWHPRKSFYVRHKKRSMMLYDVFGFFQMSFVRTCEEYLGEDDPDLVLVKEGKASRETFKYSELDDFILPYCQKEVEMLVRVMNQLRTDLHGAEIDPGKWHGPGAIASKVFEIEQVPISRELPEEVLDASQFAYAGGRFEQYQLGRYPHTVWEYDIRSAYPSAATHLPDITKGRWESVDSFEPNTFGLWNVSYKQTNGGGRTEEPQPLFCRSRDGRISYPREVQGWYWTPEAELVSSYVQNGWVFREDSCTSRPFEFIHSMYEQRRRLKLQGNSTQRALKLCLNSLYGKTAQTIGAIEGPPRWHQLEYAGYITSYVRAMIYRAMEGNFDCILATETDAVFSTRQLDLDLGTKLGQWEEIKLDEVCYIQSGLYYAIADETVYAKYRGMDRDREGSWPSGLPYWSVLDHLRHTVTETNWTYPPLHSSTTRYIGLGQALGTSAVWRSWKREPRTIRLDSGPRDGKRYHLATKCELCKQGYNLADQPHPMRIGGYSGRSFARDIPWRHKEDAVEIPEWEEMDPTDKFYAEDMEKWQ